MGDLKLIKPYFSVIRSDSIHDVFMLNWTFSYIPINLDWGLKITYQITPDNTSVDILILVHCDVT